MKCIALFLILCLACAIACAAERKPTTHELYGPIPAQVIKAILSEHGLPPTVFTVVRRVPLELGGTNAKENLMIISLVDLPDKFQFERVVLAQLRVDKTRIEQAVKDVSSWEPSR